MFTWILLIVSFSILALMFLRRLRLTRQDIGFQKNLAEEEAAVQEAELAAEAEEMEEAPEDKPAKAKSARQVFMKADTHFSRGELDEAEPLFLAVIEADESDRDG